MCERSCIWLSSASLILLWLTAGKNIRGETYITKSTCKHNEGTNELLSMYQGEYYA